jgi:hypothetical protein
VSKKTADSLAMRNAIFRMEDVIKSIPGNGIEENGVRHVHHFAPGIYGKEMICPADLFVTGMVHKTEHISIFLQGKMIVADGKGGSVEIEAPMVEIGQPGIKRAGYTVTEVRWITLHPTEETDIDKLEQMLLTNDPAEAQAIVDQEDYRLTQEPPELLERLQALPVHHEPNDGFYFDKSLRHGIGVFASKAYEPGAIIGAGIVDGKLMGLSRYMNHSAEPNAEHIWEDGNAYIVAKRNIAPDDEVTLNYRKTLLGVSK